MKRILIVDDVKGWRDFHTNVMEELFSETEITTADCAQSAYDILMSGKEFDIIITDLQMEDDFLPRLAGEWFVEQIQTFERYKLTKIVIISASYNARIIADNLNVSCIPKPTALKCFSAYQEIFGGMI